MKILKRASILLAFILVCLTILVTLNPLRIQAATSGYFTYSVYGDKATITEVNESISGAVTIPSKLGGYPVTAIGEYAFVRCTELTKITIPDSVTSIGDCAFYMCESLSDITIPDSVISIGYSAFSECYGLTSVTIGKGVTQIGANAFLYCTRLTSIQFNATAMNDLDSLSGVFGHAGTSGSGIAVTIGANVTKIPSCLFYGDNYYWPSSPKIVSIAFEQGSICESIGDYAFYECADLTSITIPSSVTTIGREAFGYCTGLTQIQFNATAMEDLDYYNDIFRCAGQGNGGIVVTIGSNVTKIPACLFIPYRESSADAPHIVSITFEKGSICESIGHHAFDLCTKLTSITIPESVTTIGTGAFYGCTGLTSIQFNAVKMNDLLFDNSVFYDAGKSDGGITVTIGADVTKIPAYLFHSAPQITSVVFEDESICETIGDYAFEECSTLTSIKIPDSVKTIGDWAFSDCHELSNLSIGNGITRIGHSAFTRCFKLTAITIPDSVTYIDGYAFQSCTGLTNITIPNSVVTIRNWTFACCEALTSVTFGDSVNSIENSAFYYCTSLKSVIYCGTKDQWNNINIGTDNTCLTSAPRSYHNWISATCTTPMFCTICGKIEVKSLGHSYSFEVTQTPTISAEGNLTCICTKCSDTIIVTLPKLDNSNYSCKEISASTCIKAGIDRYTWRITTYGSFYFDVIIPATGHNYGYDDICITCGRIKSIGDFNEDGIIDNQDVEYLLWHTLFPEDYPVFMNADFDGNYAIDNSDVEYLLWHTLFPLDYPL